MPPALLPAPSLPTQVAQHGLLKKALYRDPEGVLHVKSALCTHLGCCVEWNPLEKWVCWGWSGRDERGRDRKRYCGGPVESGALAGAVAVAGQGAAGLGSA